MMGPGQLGSAVGGTGMEMGLGGRVILVTGAAAGIGRAITEAADHEGAGTLVLVDRDAEALARAAAAPGRARRHAILADLADADAPARIAAETLAMFGRIDGLVNAAGLTSRASLTTGTASDWDSLFAVNGRAAFLLMQQAIADCLARRAAGSIVNILSMNAYCGIAELAIYAATKGALATLTKNAAHAHMADRIRVNGINLGWVATESERRMQAVVLGKGPGWEAEAAAAMPLKRLVTAEEAARLAVFLLGDASVPMSGALIDFEQKVAGAIG